MTILILAVTLCGVLYGLYRFKKKVDAIPDPLKAGIAATIRNFIEGKGGDHDWDDFLTFPMKDSVLDAIRLECENIQTQYPADKKGMWCSHAGIEKLKAIEERLRGSV
jgi:hypothetical protein